MRAAGPAEAPRISVLLPYRNAAETIEEAAQIALESPGVMGPGASVEVREIKTS